MPPTLRDADRSALVDPWDRIQVRLAGFATAGRICPRLDARTFAHAGPPIDTADLPAPLRSALIGSLLLENSDWDAERAAAVVDRGELTLVPCHDLGAVGAMTGVISPSTPVFVLRDDAGRTAFNPLGTGSERCLRFGSYDQRTLDRLRWLRDVATPLLDGMARAADINVTRTVRSALEQGDECHSRSVAGTAQFLAQIFAAALKADLHGPDLPRVVRWLSSDPHLFGGPVVGAAKLLADAAHDRPGSPVVTAIASNGHEVGIRVSGLGPQWFVAPAPVGRGMFFPGFTAQDSAPIMGDSFVAEVVGLGAMALAASPVAAAHLDMGTAAVVTTMERMRGITVRESARYRIPGLPGHGLLQGIDVHRVAARGVVPAVAAGLVHRDGRTGMIGTSIAELPLSIFVEASRSLRELVPL